MEKFKLSKIGLDILNIEIILRVVLSFIAIMFCYYLVDEAINLLIICSTALMLGVILFIK